MDRECWRSITDAVVAVNRVIPRMGRRCRYSDVLIVRMYFWAVWHDRPMCWACQREHYGRLFRPRALPSISQFSRRLRSPRVEAMIVAVNQRLSRTQSAGRLMYIDGKALPVSESSRDGDAKTGRGNGRFSRGYKLHALCTEDWRIYAFTVRPLNEHEVPVARQTLVKHIVPEAMVLADGNYDSEQLYGQVRRQKARLFTPLKGMAKPGSYRHKKMDIARRAAMELWRENPELCWSAYRNRGAIERIFSRLTCFAGGLAPLPNWVRTLPRVTRWVTAKLAIYHARLQCQNTAA